MTEINDATSQHPTSRFDAAFMTRAQALTKRLTLKPDPVLTKGSFPRPVHPLFPDQAASNELIAKALSSELSEAVKLANEAEGAAREYHRRLEAVQSAERLQQTMQEITKRLGVISSQLANGMKESHKHGDASPPNLDTVNCLDPMSHATYLAILPSVIQEFDKLDSQTNSTLRESELAFKRLKSLPGIDLALLTSLTTSIQQLEQQRKDCKARKEDVLQRVQRLKEARRLWTILNSIMDGADALMTQALESSERQRWRPKQKGSGGLPETPDPDSPIPLPSTLPSSSTPQALSVEVDLLRKRLGDEFEASFKALSPCLEQSLSSNLQSDAEGIVSRLDAVKSAIALWQNIINQAVSISKVQDEAQELGYKVDELLSELEDKRHAILEGSVESESAVELEKGLADRVKPLREEIQVFMDGIAGRIPLLVRSSGMKKTRQGSISSYMNPKAASTFEQQLKRFQTSPESTNPFDLAVADDKVRSEINSMAMRLTAGGESLNKGLQYLHLACLANAIDRSVSELDIALKSTETNISQKSTSLASIQADEQHTLEGITHRLNQFSGLIEDIDRFAQTHHAQVHGLISQLRISTDNLCSSPGARDSPIQGTIVDPRKKAVNTLFERSARLEQNLGKLRDQATKAKEEEERRREVEEERLKEEERKRIEEEERLKEEERKRLEKEELERRLREEEARLEEERRKEEERMRVEEEERRKEEERLRIEKERLKEEARRKAEEEERLKEETRKKAEEAERLRAEEAARLEKQRLEAEERRRVEKEECERRLRAQEEAANAQTARLEAERNAAKVLHAGPEDISSRTQRDPESKKPRTPEEGVFIF